jgi:hypothetical protein
LEGSALSCRICFLASSFVAELDTLSATSSHRYSVLKLLVFAAPAKMVGHSGCAGRSLYALAEICAGSCVLAHFAKA